jgi:hypothetical protein
MSPAMVAQPSADEECSMIYVAVQPAPQPAPPGERLDAINRFYAAIQEGDYAALLDLLTADAITRWPQSSERITGAMSCVRVHENYPGGPPKYRVQRISGQGDTWVAELDAEYGDERWFIVSIVEFDGPRIARMTDYFGQTLQAPEWRRDLVEREHDA